MARKILLLGKNGQVGWELTRALAPLGKLLALDRQDQGGDITDFKSLRKIIGDYKPHIIVNASAYTAVDKAEEEIEQALLINGEAVGFLAEQAKLYNSWLIHYSTDYVFDGSGNTPWQETAQTGPLNSYGQTKLAGEEAIRAVADHYLILRTSWVYGAYGHNFIKTILRLAKEQQTLNIIADQIGAPTGAELIADVTAHCINKLTPNLTGVYHLVASGETSWYEFANHIVKQAKNFINELLVVKEIKPITTYAYPTAAKRPHNSRLDTEKLTTAFDLYLPAWQLGVNRVITELLRK